MKKTIILASILFSINLFGTGVTQQLKENDHNAFWSGEVAKKFVPINTNGQEIFPIIPNRNWVLVDSISLKEFIPASYPEVQFYDIFFNRNTEMLELSTSDNSLTDSAKEAIQKSPRWIRPRLNQKLKLLSSDKQDLWSNVILSENDPNVDEIAFSIATLSVAYLSSDLAEPQVLITNADYIYWNDIFLDYVEVVDYGTSQTDEDYYSTVIYWKMNESGELEQVEIPKEIYYWYIVHPKITDEIPAFIDPEILEYNHQANIVEPDEGFFWREYLFHHTFNDTLVLSDMMEGCEYVWDGIGCNYPGGQWFAQPISPYGDSLDYALHRMTKWINANMDFISPGDRPHQPVRIAHKGQGRCGEYADLNAAVGRSLLIPTTSISNWIYIWDHTFSEMWLEDWEHYESYYWEWGATFYGTYDEHAISPFEVRSDGLLTTVTQHYVDYSTINLTILDENDNPIDGAKVILYVQRPVQSILQTMIAFTDNNGFVQFTVSDGYDYFARAETSIGNVPETGSALLVSAPAAGETYDLAMNVSAVMPQTVYSLVDPPANPIDDYKVVVEFEVPEYAVIGDVQYDDITGLSQYSKIIEDGNIDFLVVNELNSVLFQNSIDLNSVYATLNVNAGSYEFEIPEEDNWHFIFSNKNHIDNPQYVEGSVKLYQYEMSADDETIVSAKVLLNNYPNPFNPSTTISFELTEKDAKNAKIEIYNLKGQKVDQLQITNYELGVNEVTWNAEDFASGVYLYQLKAGDEIIASKKCLLLK